MKQRLMLHGFCSFPILVNKAKIDKYSLSYKAADAHSEDKLLILFMLFLCGWIHCHNENRYQWRK